MMWIPIVFAALVALMLWHTSRRMGMTWSEWKAVFVEFYEAGKTITWRDFYNLWVYEVLGGPDGIFLCLLIGFVIGFVAALHVI